MRKFLCALMCAITLGCLSTPDARAVSLTPEEVRVQTISKSLRCLVCQNQSIEDSNADLARDFRRNVEQLVKAGKTDEQIIQYMVDRYGEFVLYDPPFKASTIVLWLGPVALFIVALVALLLNLRNRTRKASSGGNRLSEEERRRARALLGEGDGK